MWNERYKASDTPWENAEHHPEIEHLFLHYVPKDGKVLEIGCGLGTMQNGYRVLAIK